MKVAKTPDQKQTFLEAYADTGNVKLSCSQAGIPLSTYGQWLDEDPEFIDALKKAEKHSVDSLEAEAYRRAVEGVDKPVFHQGKQCGVIREYSDTLLMLLLKGRAPEKYANRAKAEISGPDGGPVLIEHSMLAGLSDEELQDLINQS